MICRRLFAGFLCVLLLFCAGCITQTTVIYESDLPDTTSPETTTPTTQTTSTARSTTTTIQVGPRPTLPASFMENFEMWTEKDSYPAGVEKITVYFRRKDYSGFSYGAKYTLYKFIENEWVGQPFSEPVTWVAAHYGHGDFRTLKSASEQLIQRPASQIIDLTKLAQPLTPGTYRVVKALDEGYIYCDFTVY